jgi:hypothetical protein
MVGVPIIANTFRPGCFIALSVWLAACGHGVTRETQAVVLSVDGTASVTHARIGQTGPIEVHSHLSVGDLLKTGNGGRLRLQVVPGILSEIKADSECEVEALHVAKDGNAMVNAMLRRKAQLRFMRGVMDAVVEKKDAAGATLIIDTPFGAVNAPGECAFRIAINGEMARVLCLRGTMQVQPAGSGSGSLEAGFYRDLGTNSEPAKRAEDDEEVQGEVMGALESIQSLLAWQTREIFRPAPWRQIVTENP